MIGVPGMTMKLNPATVLILSSDPAFSREVTETWPKDGEAPEFTVLEQDVCYELQPDTYDLAIADAACGEKCTSVIEALVHAETPAIVVHSGSFLDRCGFHGNILLLRRESWWPGMVGVLGREILRRTQAESRARAFQETCAAAEAEATLGRFMVEMRHSVNNALTSVLGNAELLLLEPGLPANVLAQADTIGNMALRLHEVFQRFSSIEKELDVVARESGKKTLQSHAAANGI
jgi:signal transduction histidine kinase